MDYPLLNIEDATITLTALNDDGSVLDEVILTTNSDGFASSNLINDLNYTITILADDYKSVTGVLDTSTGPDFQYEMEHLGTFNSIQFLLVTFL